MDAEAYFKVYNAYIETLLHRPFATVKLAVLADNFDVVLGWALMEPNKLHYVHVQKDQRKQGIARELCSQSFDTITHLTNIGLSIWAKKLPLVKYNPFA